MAKGFRRRAYLFITRTCGDQRQLLVFQHTDPRIWAGVQTPGGTLEPGESPEAAALREAYEETGLRHFSDVRLLATDQYETDTEELERFFYQLELEDPCEDVWLHIGEGGGDDHGIEFQLRWLELPVAAGLHDHFRHYLDRVR